MRLLTLVLFDSRGRKRTIDFNSGLNVITGSSATGKSALLEMIEYCLGRNTLTTPVGPIRDTVSWYGLLVDLGQQRAFVGRPAPKTGNATTQQAMLELGAGVEVPDYDRLTVNADTSSVRDQLGRAIGIDENVTGSVSDTSGFEAHLGHAALFCLQRQSEIANRELLFHRQGEDGMARAIQEVLPYFLGAVAKDRAVLRQRLLAARRDLRTAEVDLRATEAADEEVEVALQAFLTEARGAGLVSEGDISGTEAGLAALRGAVTAPTSPVPRDDDDAAERERLQRRRDELRQALHQVGQSRAVLEALGSDESAYDQVVGQQAGRLRSLELLGDENVGSSDLCPICDSQLSEPDPMVAELREAAAQLQAQVGSSAVARPRRLRALEETAAEADRLRNEIRAIDLALDGVEDARRSATQGRSFAARQAFLQGRIQRYLETARLSESGETARMRERVRLRAARVQELEAQVDPDNEREQLLSRLVSIGSDMTEWANRLNLEHSGSAVRLDARRLTVVADTPTGPAPLNQIGSAANWIGYHIVAHLALHKFFVEQSRPVPRFLVLDQPTQAYYPSDVARESGVPAADADRQAVAALFLLMADVVAVVDEGLQVIVCDHANLPEPWFQDAVIENWRDGLKLIPEEWLGADEGED
jgi:hypothetical protein